MRAPITHISLPPGLSTAIAARSRELKAIGVLYSLKALHTGGLIHNFSANASLIANSFGFGRSKLLFYIKDLVKLGFISRPNKTDIRLTSSRNVALHYGCCPDNVSPTWKPRGYKLAIDRLDKIEDEIKAYAIKENLARQQYVVKRKAADEYLLTNSLLPSNPTKAARKRALRGYDPDLALRAIKTSCEDAYYKKDCPTPINPVCTLSRQGIARLLGRRSARTGTRAVQKLVALHRLTDTVSRLRLQAMTLTEFLFARSQGIYSGAYSFYKGHLWRRLSNELVYCP